MHLGELDLEIAQAWELDIVIQIHLAMDDLKAEERMEHMETVVRVNR